MKGKKILGMVLAAVLCISAAGCSSDDNSSDSSSDDNNVTEEIRDISSTELVKEMSIGWILGNTLDATGTGLDSENAWGNPTTTKDMVDLLKDSGFNVFRVPTTWEGHLDEDFNIDEEWLDRVQEVVDYGIDNDMFVILNIHHEEWHFPSYDNADAAIEKLTKIWSQIAERFKNYDEHLIFEGLNEPRKKGTAVEWTGGDAEGQEVVNRFNKAFIETVRASGGNNDKRHLMIPPYAASSSSSAMQALELPENDDKVIISIHAYTPYDFALNTAGTNQWSADNPSDTQPIDQVFKDIKAYFLDKGYAVIIGEFGSVNKLDTESETGDNLECRIAHAQYYVSKAKEYGVPCVWWDNGAFIGNGENFGLMDRSIPFWKFPQIVTALTGVDVG